MAGNATTNHVMLSYEWNQLSMVKQIKEELEKRGYKTWMDLSHMRSDTNRSMTEGVDVADVIVMCISRAYKGSDDCQTEMRYADEMQKAIIPLKIEKDAEFDGWLCTIIGNRKWIDFSDVSKFDHALDQLDGELVAKGVKVGSVDNKSSLNKDSGTSKWSEKVIGQEGQGPLEFNHHNGLAWTPSGLLLVADKDNHRIQILNGDLKYVDKITFEGKFTQPFCPLDIAVSNDNMYYIHDVENKQVIVTNESKKIIRIICQNENILCIALMGNYVMTTDYSGHRLMMFTTMGEKVTEIKGQGQGEGQFNYPFSVVVTHDQKVVVSDLANHRIQYFDSSLKFLSSHGSIGSGQNQLNMPLGLDADHKNNIYICDHVNKRVVMVTEKKEITIIHSCIERPRFIAIREGTTTRIAVSHYHKHHITVLNL
ncbi:uncharacterized protein LOC144440378 [Glandiceps talaboti]